MLALKSARRDEMVRAINDAAVYSVVSTPFEPEQLALLLQRALEVECPCCGNRHG